MLTIARIYLKNWKPFEGEHSLALEPKSYGVFARDERDARRSNYLGKSSVGQAVEYALTGRLPYDCARKVDWITWGQTSGEVALDLSDGTTVTRSLMLKGSEKLAVCLAGSSKWAAQDEAQKAIDRLLGLSRDDAETWCLRQGEASQLLKMQPGPRLERFLAWMRLEKLEDAAAIAAQARGEVERQLGDRRREVDGLKAARTVAAARVLSDDEAQKLRVELQELERRRDAAKVAEVSRTARELLVAQAGRYDEIVAQGRQAADRLKNMRGAGAIAHDIGVLTTDDDALHGRLTQVEASRSQVAPVAAGKFDGTCPLTRGACPASEHVRNAKGAAQEYCGKIDVEARELVRKREAISSKLAPLSEEERARTAAEQRLESLRAAAREVSGARQKLAQLPDAAVEPGFQEVGRLGQVREILAAHDAGAKAAVDIDEKLRAAEQEVARLERVAEIPGAGALVFEQARRVVAEGVFTEVEGYANAVLAELGADLSVAVRWGREGQGLADACGKCGGAFPRSQKVKVCARCGEARGPKVVEELHVVPSRRSGAADDLCSVAVSIGAARWLREDRGSQWGTAVVDELTSQLDAAYRSAFAGKLPAVLAVGGLVQALVVSHHRETLDALPGRIQVTSDGKRSKVAVVA